MLSFQYFKNLENFSQKAQKKRKLTNIAKIKGKVHKKTLLPVFEAILLRSLVVVENFL